MVAKLGDRLKENARESLRKEIAARRLGRDTWRHTIWAGLEKVGEVAWWGRRVARVR